MEETGETAQEEIRHKGAKSSGDNVEDQSSNATGDVSSLSSGHGNDSRRSDGAEPRRNRLLLFNKVMEKSLQKFISEASFHRFAQSFHPFYKKNPQVTENIHKQFIEDLQRTIQDDINKLIEEGELQCKLDELNKLEEAAKNSQDPAWRPSGVPEQDLCSFVTPYYLKQKAYLGRELKKILQENAVLAQRVQAGREGIAQTEQRIATAVDEWKAPAQTAFAEFQALSSSLCPPATFDV
ncbi:unnamed protein product [Oncorhynchus mykiss]|uniref:Polyamine-modulated factor 1 n=1 Tax=Oncorhynchus mykiss TaxID=8022 RepID=A0A060YFU0_ONCMY|nr:unnamed protein product [Oncorhynchus mykiss]